MQVQLPRDAVEAIIGAILFRRMTTTYSEWFNDLEWHFEYTCAITYTLSLDKETVRKSEEERASGSMLPCHRPEDASGIHFRLELRRRADSPSVNKITLSFLDAWPIVYLL